jgi:hypothetical protein
MLNKLALDLFRPLSQTARMSHAFFSTVSPIPHSNEYILLQELLLKQQGTPYTKTYLEQGEKILMCNTHFKENALVGTHHSFLKHDLLSLYAAHDELHHLYKTYYANMIEFELKRNLECVSKEFKPGHYVHFIHLSALTKIHIHSMTKLLDFNNNFNHKPTNNIR